MDGFSNISTIQKGGRIMLIVLSFFMACILIFSGALLVNSPGNAKPYLDESGKPLEGSISGKVFVDINGLRQGMFIKSKNAANPVLLYLHGGMPDYFLNEKYPTGLEDYFTMVWWEQRGSGLSYSKTIPKETMTAEQMISDTKEFNKLPPQALWKGEDLPYGAFRRNICGYSDSSYVSGIRIVWTNILATDLSEKVTELNIPVYFFEGVYDFTCSYTEAKSYFEALRAPIKGFYTFGKSAHSPIFEEPLRVREIIIQDVLKGRTDLADKNLE